MPKKKIILGAVVIAFSIALLPLLQIGTAYFFLVWRYQGQYTIMTKDNAPSSDFKIKTKDQAIAFAIGNGMLDKPDYAEIHKNVGEELTWSLSAYKRDGNWNVKLNTQGMIPSYSCNMTIKSTEKLASETCQWNK